MEHKHNDDLMGAILGFCSAIGKWMYDLGTINIDLVVPSNIKDAFLVGIAGTLAGLITTQIWKWCAKKYKQLFNKK